MKECKSTKLYGFKQILGIYVPCIHRINKGANFPDAPVVNFTSRLQWNELIVEQYQLDEENYQEEISLEKIDLDDIFDMIHKYCKCKRQKLE